jgi:hypothetical protein
MYFLQCERPSFTPIQNNRWRHYGEEMSGHQVKELV